MTDYKFKGVDVWILITILSNYVNTIFENIGLKSVFAIQNGSLYLSSNLTVTDPSEKACQIAWQRLVVCCGHSGFLHIRTDHLNTSGKILTEV